MLRIAWFATTTWLCLSGCTALTCHCLNDAACSPADGSCANGCEKGWYGPGCQIGNVALKKRAFQSSTYADYIAENAVNGYFPSPNDETASNCSHTLETITGVHWWYVILSDVEDYVLKNITIVNMQGISNDHHLRNFYILYTRNVTTPPDLTTWDHCTFQKQYQSTTVATYTCENQTAIGRRVAVYLVAGSTQGSIDKLTLCEVFVDGYSYNESSMFQNVVTNVMTDCESIAVNLSKSPIVPPTYLVVQLIDHNKHNMIYIERVRNQGNGLQSVAVRSMANGTYSLSVSPETCCIGSQCLDSFTMDNSMCVIGPSTVPLNVTIPPLRQYGLKKTGIILSIISLNDYPCSSEIQRVNCSQSGTSTVNCSDTVSCELDPRYNYTCLLEASFKDGSKQASTANIYISTADFSTLRVSEWITCNSIELAITNVTELWDLAPSGIDFYLSATGAIEIRAARVSATVFSDISATFAVISNTSYYAWAAPITFWSRSDSLDIINGSCSDPNSCMTGKATPTKVIKSLPRQYIFTNHGCCVSVQDISPNQCKEKVTNKILCTMYETSYYEGLISKNTTVCGLKPNKNYTCCVDVYISDGKVESHCHISTIDNRSECPPVEEIEGPDKTSPAIWSAVTTLIVLTAVILVATLKFRMHERIRERARLRLTTTNQRSSCHLNNQDRTSCNATSTSREPQISPAISDIASKFTDSSGSFNTGLSDSHDMGPTVGRDSTSEIHCQLPESDCQYESLRISSGESNETDYQTLYNHN